MGHDHGPRRDLVLPIMTAGYFLVLLDVTIINVTLPSIRPAEPDRPTRRTPHVRDSGQVRPWSPGSCWGSSG
jgi:hypothetical protein